MIEDALIEPTYEILLKIPYANGKQRAWLFANNLVASEAMTDDGYEISVNWTKGQQAQFENQ